MKGRRDIETPIPTGRAGKMALYRLRLDLGDILTAMDAGQSLGATIRQLVRAIAVALLP